MWWIMTTGLPAAFEFHSGNYYGHVDHAEARNFPLQVNMPFDQALAADGNDKSMTERDDTFELWDLRVEIVGDKGRMVCGHRIGDYFELSGENLSLPANQSFSVYALAALLPLLPAKQRMTDANDWMTTDTEVACPDPNCGARFRITRTGKSTFRHSETTAVPLPPVDDE